MTEANSTLPHWNMEVIFPSIDSPEFERELAGVSADIHALAALCDSVGVRRRAKGQVDPEFAAQFDEVTNRFNDLYTRLRTVGAYVSCIVSTDARNEKARALESDIQTRSVPVNQMHTRYVAWVGASDVEELLRLSEVAKQHEYPVRRAQVLAQHQMSEPEEELAAELRPSSIGGWANLHDTMNSLLMAKVCANGEETRLPISAVRALATDSDRAVRKAAFEAELAAWESVSEPYCAAMNGVKGYQQTLRRRRRYMDDIEPTLFSNGIDRETLSAMQTACAEAFPDLQRYMRTKARALSLDRLAWYDLNAPLGRSDQYWTWSASTKFIVETFSSYSERLAAFAQRAFEERWIDAEPREGKRDGGYCSGIRPGESRVFMNFDGSYNAVSTLAHELGHAYHGLNMKDLPAMLRGSPATLAETASIFCETISFEAALKDAGSGARLVLLDASLQRDLQVIVDIHSRFLFEKEVFERRTKGDLSVSEMNRIMLEAQRQTYGPDLEPLHPFMWAVKGHYYGPTFYNYPYTYGLLFGLGLYAEYRKSPDAFRARYDELLASTGQADAAALGKRFGLDVASLAFWRSSLDVVREQIVDFEGLVA